MHERDTFALLLARILQRCKKSTNYAQLFLDDPEEILLRGNYAFAADDMRLIVSAAKRAKNLRELVSILIFETSEVIVEVNAE